LGSKGRRLRTAPHSKPRGDCPAGLPSPPARGHRPALTS
jgi:hypothetical protein